MLALNAPRSACINRLRVGKSAGRQNNVKNLRVGASKKDNQPQQEDNPSDGTGFGLKAVWYGAEQFGNLVGLTKRNKATEQTTTEVTDAPLTMEQTLEAIRADYSVNYFISGQGSMEAYAPDCVFADPFVSFRGVQRFKKNVSNLGGLMSDVSLDVFDWKVEGNRLITRWRFSCFLDLPWHPKLAAAGGTTHVIDEATGKVVEHIERWDVEPGKVVQQLLRPGSNVPTNFLEAMMLALGARDGTGVWLLLAPGVLKLAGGVLVADLGVKLVTGDGIPGLDGAEWVLVLGVVAAVVTEVLKFAGGMQGGETGTGGRF